MNKKGAEFTVTTLVVIVLALVVLVVLALGFGTGWQNLWDRLSGLTSPVNVDAVKQACSYACSTQAEYNYCQIKRDVKLEGGKSYDDLSCSQLANRAEFEKLGFEKCEEIKCPLVGSAEDFE